MIHVATEGAVTTVTLDRPERRNAVDHATLVELRQIIARAAEQRVRALVLAGAGGHVLRRRRPHRRRGSRLRRRAAGRAHRSRPSCRPPPSPRCRAPRSGAGCQLAMACDLRVGTASAYFGIPANRLGLMVDAWTIQRVAQLVGGSVARAMLLAAQTVSADEARRDRAAQPHRRPGGGDGLGSLDRRAGAAQRGRPQAGAGAAAAPGCAPTTSSRRWCGPCGRAATPRRAAPPSSRSARPAGSYGPVGSGLASGLTERHSGRRSHRCARADAVPRASSDVARVR